MVLSCEIATSSLSVVLAMTDSVETRLIASVLFETPAVQTPCNASILFCEVVQTHCNVSLLFGAYYDTSLSFEVLAKFSFLTPSILRTSPPSKDGEVLFIVF